MTEHDIQNNIRLELSKRGIINFRANVGKVKMADGRYFDTGLPNGFSDLFGIMPDGRAVFIECKTPAEHAALLSRIKRGKPTRHDTEQLNFIEQMRKSNALAGFASTVSQALEICGIGKDDAKL